MVLINDCYQVTITTESMPLPGNSIVIYNPDDLNLSDYYAARMISVVPLDGAPSQLALIDKSLSSSGPCAVLENRILTVILFDKILRIDLATRLVIQCVECDNTGGLEQIHPLDYGYIIKGECDIFRYDSDLNQMWQFCGRDIFASPNGDKCFWINDGVIHCRDWLGWHYTLDFDGQIISESPERSPSS